jgi:hypothetical protein
VSIPSPDLSPLRYRVGVALQFGWTLAEVYGRLEDDPPPRTPPASTRLFLSDLNPSPDERLWLAARRLAYLACQLLPAQHLHLEGALPGVVQEIIESAERRILTGRGKLPRPEAVYDDLNQWSRDVWATLDAENPLLSAAATLGAGLADTYWQWHVPTEGHAVPAKQRWQHLLHPQRLIATIRQVREVETYLPAHVGPMMRHSLWEWGIAGELKRTPAGDLTVGNSWLYNLRSLGVMRAWRRRRSQSWRKTPVEINPAEEMKLRRRLLNQVLVWEHLVFNRPLVRLLTPSDWRLVRWVSFLLYVAAIVLIATVAGYLLGGFVQFIGTVLGHIWPLPTAPVELKDQLALASALVAVVAFLATQFRRGLSPLRHLYDNVRVWVTMRKMEQCGLRAWNGHTKPVILIWLQRLLRAEDE